ncbi:MAG TPA: hypothetical protein VE623_24795 [Acidimicrobiales bacterium]|nr:hypothetical protein [Acidimicrobiales bacterium]
MDDVIPGTVAHWVARRLPVADDDHRVELAESVASAVAERPRCERAWEAASLVGLWLRLWGRREGGDDAWLALRQGVYLGGLLLASLASAQAWSHAGHVDHAGAAGLAAVVVGAVLASGAAALAAGGWRVGALAAAVGSLVAGTLATGTPPAVGLVAALALLAGDRFGARRCWRGLTAGTLAAGVLAGLAVYAPAGVVPAGEGVVLVALPLAFLFVGWFDPRFSVAATAAWLGAFVAFDARGWPRAIDDGLWSPDLPRGWVLGAAVVIAGQVSRTALRRAFAV